VKKHDTIIVQFVLKNTDIRGYLPSDGCFLGEEKIFRHVGGYLLHQIWIPRDLDPRDPREKAAAAPPDGNGAY
jgi:hypothetical protein